MKARWLQRLVPRSRPVLQGALAVCLVGSALLQQLLLEFVGAPTTALERRRERHVMLFLMLPALVAQAAFDGFQLRDLSTLTVFPFESDLQIFDL